MRQTLNLFAQFYNRNCSPISRNNSNYPYKLYRGNLVHTATIFSNDVFLIYIPALYPFVKMEPDFW